MSVSFENDREYAIALALCPWLERRSLNHLVDGMGSAYEVWNSREAVWLSHCRLRPPTLNALHEWRTANRPQTLLRHLHNTGVVAIVQGDTDYPFQLYQLGRDAPRVLFAKGQFNLLSQTSTPMISVVGTRRASTYGLEATRWVVNTLAGAGCTIVSGLALGVDGAAHRAALEAHGRTIAVLGCGVNVCYPPSHRVLYDDVAKEGLVLSEYPPDTAVAKHHFPERNRIIAALSHALVIAQAGARSGALRTVDWALQLGKDIYVVPGPITSKLFRGSNQLLKDGASVLLDPVDLLTDLNLSGAAIASPSPSSETVTTSRTTAGTAENTTFAGSLSAPGSGVTPTRWTALYEALDTAQSAGALAQVVGLPHEAVFAALMELELSGWIVRLPGGLYQRKQLTL